MITLHAPTTTDFTNLGLGVLADVITARVTEERNGPFELELTYPATGRLFSSVSLRSIICAKPNPDDGAQPFRIYKITKPINGIVTIYAQHISYDLNGYVVSPYTAANLPDALAGLNTNSTEATPFTFSTSRTTAAAFSVKEPKSIRSAMGGTSGSILDTYGGEWKFDKFACIEYLHRGSNRGVVLEYGKNITDLQQEENNTKIFTAVYPYWKSEDTLVTLTEKTVPVPGTFSFTRILTLDLSGEFSEQPTEAQLRTRAESYITANAPGTPEVSISVSFQNLRDTEEYKTIAALETIKLCDTITVRFPALGVSAEAKIIKTVYDAVGQKYVSLDIGAAKTNLADTIVGLNNDVQSKPNITQVITAANDASALITGNKGGYVRLNDSDGDGLPDEILVMDTPNISTATKVWRWNLSGWGYSSTGYAGPYALAATMNGEINADFIKAGTIAAARINGDGLDVSNATIDNCTITALCRILGTLQGNTIASNTDGGTTGQLTFNDSGYQLEAINGTNEMRLSVGFNSLFNKYAILGASGGSGFPVLQMIGENASLEGHQVTIAGDGDTGDKIELIAVHAITADANSVKIKGAEVVTKRVWSDANVDSSLWGTYDLHFWSNGEEFDQISIDGNSWAEIDYIKPDGTWVRVCDGQDHQWTAAAYKTMAITWKPHNTALNSILSNYTN